MLGSTEGAAVSAFEALPDTPSKGNSLQPSKRNLLQSQLWWLTAGPSRAAMEITQHFAKMCVWIVPERHAVSNGSYNQCYNHMMWD